MNRLPWHRGLVACVLASMLAATSALNLPSARAAGTITGRAFRDLNANGAFDPTEMGQGGVVVMVYDAAGADQGTATTASDGTYSIAAGGTGPYRVEFTLPTDGSLSYLEPGAYGTSNNSGVQFVPDGNATVNYGLSDPQAFCQDNPQLCTSVYVQGDAASTVAPFSTLTASPYNSSGISPEQTSLGTKAQVGSTWGLAYNRRTTTLYAAAFLKRHTGLGPNGLGAIYQVPDANTATPGTPTLLVDLAAQGIDVGQALLPATRDLHEPTGRSHDPDVFGLVGKVGLGGMSISNDQTTLWVTNLQAKTLVRVPIATPTAANIASIPLPNSNCVGGEARPFGVEVHHSSVYVGVICDAQSSAVAANLKATVYRYDPAQNVFTNVLEFPLNYPKGYVDSNCPSVAQWNSWLDTFSTCDWLRAVRPQPMLADIAFDSDGSMVLSFMDRTGHQTGNRNYSPTVSDTDTFIGIPGGDILRAAAVTSGTFQLESAGIVGGRSGAANNQGPGGGEFYASDNYTDKGTIDNHQEVVIGGLALKPGSGEVAVTTFDTLQKAGYLRGGVRFLSNLDGGLNRGYQIHGDGLAYAGKSNGLGDLELLCDSAPIEIGNRIWNDVDHDGVQNAGEPGMAGVTVELVDTKGNVVSTAETNADGNYYFSSATGTSTGDTKYGLPLAEDADYTVRVPTAQPALAGLQPSAMHTDTSANGDARDSDGVVSGTYSQVAFSTGAAGANNHAYDFGFFQSVYDLAIVKTLAAGQPKTFGQGDTVNYTLTVKNQGNVPSGTFTVTDQIPAGMTFASATGDGFSCTEASGVVICAYAPPTATDLAPGATATINLSAKISDAAFAPFRNWAEISSDSGDDLDSTPDTDTGNDDGAGTGTPPNDKVVGTDNIDYAGTDDEDDNDYEDLPIFDVALRKRLATGQNPYVKAGDDVTFTITVFNQGTITATTVLVTDYIPTGLSLNDPDWTAGTNSIATTTVAGPIAPGTSAPIDITLRVNQVNTSIVNAAEISGGDDDNDPNTPPPTDIDSTPDGTSGNQPGEVPPIAKDDETGENGKNGGDEDDYDTAPLLVLDLALRKTLATGQSGSVKIDDLATFTVTVFNQGFITATDVLVTDYLPAGLELADTDWTAGISNTATATIAGPIAPGASASVDVTVKVRGASAATDYRNVAEISGAKNEQGTTLPDADSTPDTNPDNDGPAVDDDIADAPPVDEDDSDFATLTLTTVRLPHTAAGNGASDGTLVYLLTIGAMAFTLGIAVRRRI